MKHTKVVTMGGGTGTFAVIAALKQLPTTISSIVAVSDSGGSTGRIRDEFGFPPVGDLRQSLAALADPEGQKWIRKILLYRFSKGTGLKGHNLGNLILTALQDMTGSTTESMRIASKVFDLVGEVIPVTTQNVDLVIEYEDGSKAIGEHLLDEEIESPKKIARVHLEPNCDLNPPAYKAITGAEYIFIGPGDLYASIMATLVVPDITKAFAESQAKLVYLPNLMTRKTQTHNMSAADHLAVIEGAIGKQVDQVIINTETVPEKIKAAYARAGEHPVKNDLAQDPRVTQAPLLSEAIVNTDSSDTVHRSLLRHDPEKLVTTFKKIIG